MTETRGIAPGKKIGKYTVLSHVATGGMAEIYLARAQGIGRFEKLFVLKRILPGTGDRRAMLLDEARIVATLDHPNIVQVFDVGEFDGECFFIMEYLHGKDAHTVGSVARAGLSEDQALTIVLGVCAGLHYAHEKPDEDGRPLGIVHRDVSPTNIFLTFDGGVKLLDFGLVKAEGRSTESRSSSFKGKLAYMSPEQCRAKPCDRRSDVFSLATVLWELTTGARLFVGDCDFDFMQAVLEKEIPRPSTVKPGYPAELERIVMKGLSRNPDDRYPTAEAMQLELEEYAREHRLKVSPITLRQLMAQLFADEIIAWQEAKRTGREQQLVNKDVPLAVGSVLLARTSDVMRAQPADESRPVQMPPQLVSAAPTTSAFRPWMAALALAVFALGAFAIYRATGNAERPAATPAMHEASPTQPVPPPPPQAPTPATAAPATVTLTFELSPPGSMLEIDGTRHDGPTLERAAGAHVKVRASAPGYVAQSLDVLADGDRGIRIELKRAPARPARPTGVKKSNKGPIVDTL